jgi:hypothetical protein
MRAMTWETVATFDNAVAAEMAKNLLEGHGIPVMISDEETVATAWSLSNAVGGIKLRVPVEELGRAEFFLEVKAPPPVTDADIADAVAASPAIAEGLAGPGPPEPFDDTATDREVDRIFKATAFALLFFPLQLYTLYRLWMLRYADPPVRPRDRWKVRLSYALSLPLWFAVIVPATLILGRFFDRPHGPTWRNERFGGLGDVALTIDFPSDYLYDLRQEQSVLGPLNVRVFGTAVADRSLIVTLMDLPKELTPQDPPAALRQFVDEQFARSAAKFDRLEPTSLDGYPGLEAEALLPMKGAAPRFFRERVYLVDHHIVVLSADIPPSDKDGPDAARFFGSARIR